MSLWRRFIGIFKAKVNRHLDSMEKVDETLDYGFEKQRELLQNVKKGIADVVTSKKRVQIQADKLRQQVVKLDRQARQALGAGREDLARAALERKQLAQSQLDELDAQIAGLQAQQDKLVDNERKLRAKIERFGRQKEVIKAQYSAAEAQVQISEAATGIGNNMADVGLAMQRAMDKTEQMTARAAAVEELEAAGAFELPGLSSGGDDIDRELAALTSASEVDNELDKLRVDLGVAPAAPELEAAPATGTLTDPQREAAPVEQGQQQAG